MLNVNRRICLTRTTTVLKGGKHFRDTSAPAPYRSYEEERSALFCSIAYTRPADQIKPNGPPPPPPPPPRLGVPRTNPTNPPANKLFTSRQFTYHYDLGLTDTRYDNS